MNGGVVIRVARLRAGLSQRALAARAGTTQNAISRWERGVVEPGLRTVNSVVEACGMRLHVTIADPDPHEDALHAAVESLTPGERLEVAAGWARLRERAKLIS